MYIINIKPSDIVYLLNKVREKFPEAKEETSLTIKYLKENNQYSKYMEKVEKDGFIDINKKAITIALANSEKRARRIAKRLNKYDIYIYKTQETKKSYYAIYAVNINKKDLKSSLKYIKRYYKDAYISSNARVKKLATHNFDENIFIKQNKKGI